MNAVRIAVLDASHDDTNTRRNFRRELDAELAEFDVTAGQLPDGFAYDACVVTGSRSSVYWGEAWIEPLKAWITRAIDRDLPFLGVCYGHQLLADVLGGSVADMGEYEIGYREIERPGDSRLLAGLDARFVAFTTHSDYVASPPPGATVLAENEYGNHGFRLGHVFGVQFHPEYDMETAHAVIEEKDLPAPQRCKAIESITEANYAAACEAKIVFEHFIDYVREQRQQQARAGVTQPPSASSTL